MSKKFNDLILGFVFFLVHFLILTLGYRYIRNITIVEEKNRYKYIAINEANFISSSIDKVIVRTYTLREMIIENDGNTDFFEKTAPVLIHSIKEDTGIQVRNLLLAPDGIVSKIEPLKNNEDLMGFDYTDITKTANKEALEAIIKSKTILTNPFPLLQGGIGMAARTPVYLNPNKKSGYWGLVSATMDFEDILENFALDTFSKMQVNYRLWYENDKNEPVVLSTNCNSLKDYVTEKVTINNLTWYLDLCPSKGWRNENLEKLAYLIIFVISGIMASFVHLMFRIRRDGNKMKKLAEQDNLTHCYSRYYLNSVMLDPVKEDWRTPESNYSIAIIDIDKFKYINDTYGHITGDKVLVKVAEVLAQNVSKPQKDRIVRFGGDEFMLFFSNIERKTLRIKFQDILSGVEQIRFDEFPDLRLTVSIGVAIPENLEEPTYKNMVKLADDNLYKVKQNGRNNYLMVTPKED